MAAPSNIGQALHERTVYDAGGQLVTASLMDYRLPRAADVPDFRFETRNVPSTTNAMGMKGAGEAGDRRLPGRDERRRGRAASRVRHPDVDMPATPDQITALIREAQAGRAAWPPHRNVSGAVGGGLCNREVSGGAAIGRSPVRDRAPAQRQDGTARCGS